MGRLFGTDGTRDTANADLTYGLAMNIGRTAAMVLGKGDKHHPEILTGKDMRVSSDMLEGMLTTSFCNIGMNVVHLGVMPIPTVTYLVKEHGADTGVMVSASHDPCELSGIKVFSNIGYKLPDVLEEQIEATVFDHEGKPQLPTGGEVGSTSTAPQALRDYTDHVKNTVPENALKGLRIALDCANGFSAMTAQTLSIELDAECHMLSDTSNGVNTNDNYGFIHMETLMQCVRANHMDADLMFDGGADRCLTMDEQGQLVDGDFLMATCVFGLKSQGRLAKSAAVSTIVTGMGSIRFYEENGIKFAITKVSGRYVLEEMLQEDHNLGGEQSGHIIFLDRATTDDGQMTSVQLLTIPNHRRVRLSSLVTLMACYLQVMVNVTTSREGKLCFYTGAEVSEATEHAKACLGAKDRAMVHPSGTEPLLHVMTGGEDHDEISAPAHEVASVVRERLA